MEDDELRAVIEEADFLATADGPGEVKELLVNAVKERLAEVMGRMHGDAGVLEGVLAL